ncbi:MAG: TonB-dependent receptor [Bacteroidales bacterium]|nr:TonB-dependent receptor [Bacteroidales bacterium]
MSVSWSVLAQEADTLAASSVSSVKSLPVTRAAEEMRLTGVEPLVSDAVRRFTGVQLKDYGGAGGLKTVNVRSLGSEHVGVFIGGIQVDNAQNMQVDLGRFSTESFSSVALYNGQKSRRLQTAKEYASGAALYLEPAKPEKDAWRIRARVGSFPTAGAAVRRDKVWKDLRLSAGAEFLYSGGRYRYRFFDTTLVRENSDIRSLKLDSRLEGRLLGGVWDLYLYAYGSERGFPGPVIRRASGFPFSAERQADQDAFLQGGWRYDTGIPYSAAVRFKLSDSYTHYDTHPEKNPMALPYDLHFRQRSAYVSLAQSLALGNRWSVDLSTDAQRSVLQADRDYAVKPERTTLAAVLAGRYMSPKLRAAAHILWQGAWDAGTFRGAWMPSASLHWEPLEWLGLDAFVKRSCRLPSFNDLYYIAVGNVNLRPEYADQAGLDLRLQGRHLAFRVSPYCNLVTDKIVALPTATQFRWSMLNIGKVDIAGVDTRLEASNTFGECKLQGTLRYTFQSALDHSDPSRQTYGNQIPYAPVHSGSVNLQAEWRGWTLAWETSVTGHRWSTTSNTADYYLPPWTVSDVSLGKSFGIFNVSLRAGNIFNAQYQMVKGYPMPGANVMLCFGMTYANRNASKPLPR